MNYAPIMIPTLDRYEKLVNCIESLSKNKGAENTEIYISLDYPPDQRYVEGYKKIDKFIADIDRYGFKRCHIYRQLENLGPRANNKFLKSVVRKEHDTYISTEDDNVFSPCFLDYINKGLELFANDEKVIMICGYRGESHKLDPYANVSEVYNFLPWGYASWFYKIEKVQEQISREYFRKILKDRNACSELISKRSDLYRYLFEAAMTEPSDMNGIYGGYLDEKGNIAYIDHTYSPIMAINGLYGIAPNLSLVRNTGVEDSSGVHTCIWTDFKYAEQKISEASEFNYDIRRSLNGVLEESDDISPAAKRAWILRHIYLVLGLDITRGIMRISYYLTKFINEKIIRKDRGYK